jgi:hypothetical protein
VLLAPREQHRRLRVLARGEHDVVVQVFGRDAARRRARQVRTDREALRRREVDQLWIWKLCCWWLTLPGLRLELDVAESTPKRSSGETQLAAFAPTAAATTAATSPLNCMANMNGGV